MTKLSIILSDVAFLYESYKVWRKAATAHLFNPKSPQPESILFEKVAGNLLDQLSAFSDLPQGATGIALLLKDGLQNVTRELTLAEKEYFEVHIPLPKFFDKHKGIVRRFSKSRDKMVVSCSSPDQLQQYGMFQAKQPNKRSK